MGIENSRQNIMKQRHDKFLKIFLNNYSLKQQQINEVFGQIKLYMNINTKIVEVIQKIVNLNTEGQSEIMLKTMEKRISKPVPNLLRIYSVKYVNEDKMCGNLCYAHIYTEYLHKNLKGELQKRRKNGSYLSEEVLLKISVSLLNGITYLHEQNIFHGEIRAENILVDGSFHLKLVERALLNPCKWQIVANQQLGFKILKGRGVLLSPCILECLKDQSTQMVNYDAFKADIYAIGMIILECCSLKKAQNFYDYQAIQVKGKEIAMTIYECRKKYSHNLMNLVQKMLQPEDADRLTAKQLMTKMSKISGDTLRQMNTTLNQSFLSETIRSYM